MEREDGLRGVCMWAVMIFSPDMQRSVVENQCVHSFPFVSLVRHHLLSVSQSL